MISDYRAVTIEGGFWKQKQDLNAKVTMQAVYDRFFDTGRIDAFRCDWKPGMDKQPHYYWDSDVAKWIEAASYVIAKEDRPDLVEKVEQLIDEIEKNRDENGYFNIYFTVVEPEARFTNRNKHELYCAGHLMEAACAYYEATGRSRFLSLMEDYAHYIEKVFVKEQSAKFTTPGHEEIELALFRMFQATGKREYLDLCAFFLENRGDPGHAEQMIGDSPLYAQSHAPVRKQREAFGHAVRAAYLYSAMADYAGQTGDGTLLAACRALFEDVTKRKMYVTGGIGSTRVGEAFTAAYDLPNATAYAETCASIGMILFADRMFRVDPTHSSEYADIVELELYNGALSGLSLDGKHFFYENPLEINLAERSRFAAYGKGEPWSITQRVEVFSCSCCPPNLNRLLGSVGKYFYACDEEEKTVWVNQFASSSFSYRGAEVRVSTDYPMDGKITVESNVPVCLRLPGWCASFTADRPYEKRENGYLRFEAGKTTVVFDMTPTLLAASPFVRMNFGKAALRCGPFLYCAEAADNAFVHSLFFDSEKIAQAEKKYSPFFGANLLTVKGFTVKDSSPALYAPMKKEYLPTDIRMIPYAFFANRGEGDMLVWMPYR